MKEKAYDALADWFEYLNDDCGYEEWSQYLLSLLSGYGAGKKGLDVGCGSGYFTRKLHRGGYAVTGVDNSVAMLSKAQELARKEGCNIPFVAGDVASLRTLERVDFVTAVNDCFNYVSPQKLVSAFKRVHGCLKKGGLFFFDISSEKKLSNLPPVSVDDREDVTYLAFNRAEGARVTMEVSLFIRKEGREEYIRRDETHIQYIYAESEILSALAAAGFELLFGAGHLGGDKADSDRLEFLARRI